MHEWRLAHSLVTDITRAAALHDAIKILTVKIRVGPLAGISADHLREQFRVAALGSIAEGASLEIVISDGLNGDEATRVVIESLEVAD
ncbi:MAG TPA: hydrogenase maturation nickel metallochaperone HypA [Candidatus Binatia bacterium]|nr:hydrogenase maturation nickel metallochaperone HypA [Candidatus Binatia bacterium]